MNAIAPFPAPLELPHLPRLLQPGRSRDVEDLALALSLAEEALAQARGDVETAFETGRAAGRAEAERIAAAALAEQIASLRAAVVTAADRIVAARAQLASDAAELALVIGETLAGVLPVDPSGPIAAVVREAIDAGVAASSLTLRVAPEQVGLIENSLVGIRTTGVDIVIQADPVLSGADCVAEASVGRVTHLAEERAADVRERLAAAAMIDRASVL